MKAEYNGVKLEGAPEEIAKVIELVGVAKKVEPLTVPTTYPYIPWWQQQTWIVTCDGTNAKFTDAIYWNGQVMTGSSVYSVKG